MPQIVKKSVKYAGNIYDTQPVGEIVQMTGSKNPAGYLPCDGRSVKRSDYPELYSKIGTTFGAEDEEHFNLPTAQQATSGGGGITVTEEEYEALSDAEKDSDISFYIPDSDGVDLDPVDVVEDGNMSAVTSNAVNGALTNYVSNRVMKIQNGASYDFTISDNGAIVIVTSNAGKVGFFVVTPYIQDAVILSNPDPIYISHAVYTYQASIVNNSSGWAYIKIIDL